MCGTAGNIGIEQLIAKTLFDGGDSRFQAIEMDPEIWTAA